MRSDPRLFQKVGDLAVMVEILAEMMSDLRGYASQLQVRDWIENPAAAIDSPIVGI